MHGILHIAFFYELRRWIRLIFLFILNYRVVTIYRLKAVSFIFDS